MRHQNPIHLSRPIEKKISLTIVNLLRNGKAAEALSFIDEGRKINSEGFSHPFIDYLYSRASQLSLKSTCSSQPSFNLVELKDELSHNIADTFKSIVHQSQDHQYRDTQALASDKVVAKVLAASTVSELEKILPYKGKIYLPTSKYSCDEQIDCIKRTAAFLSDINKRVTAARLKTLRTLIVECGFNECVIVANGPSLKSTNLAMLEGVFLIGLNSIFLHPYITPHVIVCEDHLVGEDRRDELNNYVNSIKIFPGYLTYCLIPDNLTIVLNHRPRVSFPVDIDFSDSIEQVTFTGGTVTYTALQLAIGLGFKKVSLVGCDATYKVENVKEESSYSTGILESLGDDPNHFNATYFGKGYRWHDPNPLRMMQAYSVADRYAAKNGITISNLTRGGMLEVFRRSDFLEKIYTSYPRVCIADWIDINSNAATGEVKKALFKDWPKDKLLHIYSPKPNEILAFRSSPGDTYHSDLTSILPAWKAIIECKPDCYYWRPTHNRPILSYFVSLLLSVERKPFTLHLMDYWTVKIDDTRLKIAYERALESSIRNAAHLFVISHRMKARVCNRYNLASQHVSVAHNYVPALPTLDSSRSLDRSSDTKVIYYSGNLDPDQSLDPLIDICEAIKLLNLKGKTHYKFIISTSDFHRKTNAHRLSDYDFVNLQSQTDDFNVYIMQSSVADLCILCYGFGSQSRDYLLDSMANKLPDILLSKSKFFAYGEPEIGTLHYLRSVGYPFVEFSRDPAIIAEKLEFVSSMEYDSYVSMCSNSFQLITQEFSEMTQCHTFQRQLASASAKVSTVAGTASDYSGMVDLYGKIFSRLGPNVPKGLNDELRLMLFLASQPGLVGLVYERVRDHGLTWSVNSAKNELSKALHDIHSDQEIKIRALAWMIATQRHSRYEELWGKLFKSIVGER